jgi:hypothetical protein
MSQDKPAEAFVYSTRSPDRGRGGIRSSPGLASSRAPARGSRPPRPSPPRGASKTCTAAVTRATPRDMALDGVAGEVLYPSQGLFYFKLADPPLLMSAILRAYNDWLAEFCRTDPARLKGIATINLDASRTQSRSWSAPPAWASAVQ